MKLRPKKQEEDKKLQSMFTVGYSEVRKRVSKGSKYTMSCYNCNYFYQSEEDTEEVCQNLDVLSFDMIITDTTVYCNRWEISQRGKDV